MRISIHYDRGQSMVQFDGADLIPKHAECIVCGSRALARFAYAAFTKPGETLPEYHVACLCKKCPGIDDPDARDFLELWPGGTWLGSVDEMIAIITTQAVMAS